jgi:hypothetical protein
MYDLARQGTDLGQRLQLEEGEMAQPYVLAHQLVLGLVELDRVVRFIIGKVIETEFNENWRCSRRFSGFRGRG